MVLGLLSNVLFVLEEKEKAVEACHSAAEKCRELGGTINEARALIYLAFAAENTYQIERAKTLLESSLDLMDREGDRLYRHTCVFLLGRICNWLGDFDRAEEHFLELQDFWSRRGSKFSEAGAYLYLGRIALERGDAEAAKAHARAAERLLSGGACTLMKCAGHAHCWPKC